jgi:hypothetical protein
MSVVNHRDELETIARLVRRDFRLDEIEWDIPSHRILESEIDGTLEKPHRIKNIEDGNQRTGAIAFEKGLSFSEQLFTLIDDGHVDEVKLYQYIGVSKSVFSKIRSNQNYQPDKDTVFKFAIGLKLKLETGIDLLASAGFNFKVSSHRDLVIRHCLSLRKYDLMMIDELLIQFNEKPLFSLK